MISSGSRGRVKSAGASDCALLPGTLAGNSWQIRGQGACNRQGESTVERLRQLVTVRNGVVLAVLLGAVAIGTKSQWDWVFADDEAQTVGAVAPALEDVDEDTERLYRIASDNGSSLTYSVEENVAGTAQTTTGRTEALAGDIAVNVEDPSASRMGTIVMNVEMFESDSALRDKRIRSSFLESTDFPMATFEATTIEGLPSVIEGDADADLTITGDLTVKETTAPVTFGGAATMNDDTLKASMTGTVLMSDYDVGPIDVAGLVHTGDEVVFTLEVVAERTDVGTPPPGERRLVVSRDQDFAEGEFAENVQPILESACVSCHEAGASGSHAVELDTAGQAADTRMTSPSSPPTGTCRRGPPPR